MVIFWIVVGGVGSFLTTFIPKLLDSSILNKSIDGRINQKQAETNAAVAEKLTRVNVDKQEAETFIDLSNAVADIAKQGVANTAREISELHHMLKESLEANVSHSRSSELLLEAKEHHAEATNDLAKAMQHLVITIESLTQAQKLLPQEIAVFIDSHAKEMSVSLDGIDRRLELILKEIKLAEARIIDQYSSSIAQLRYDVKQSKSN
jgi:hypothetical protein